ncbi:14134_t:CDS:2 [Funneliformis geosporum]|uniref:83_t:CDS:1 n=1 Tax=Funneliformis geosporum TaxID=1117311 RepID=A0A9W4WR21_9GLOM|nr:14134_t:CDS:2 [Funneliformis geosporum]CAI2172569.1 83_t:CDS:2 [Funneliformis geosporum]
MGRTLARVTVFLVSVSLLLYSIFVATVTFIKLNFTASHLSEPLLIGYGVIFVIIAPSGLWGIIGSTQNNSELYDRYLRDHWFSSGVVTIMDGIKIVLSFTMKNDSIKTCLTPTDSSEAAIGECRRRVEFNQKAGLIIFGAQEFFLIVLGILVWFSCKRIARKTNGNGKEVLERLDLNEYIPDESNDASINAYNLREQRQNLPLERIDVQPPSPFAHRRPSQYIKGQNDRRKIEQIKPEPMPNILRSREVQGDQYDDSDNVQYTTPQRPRRTSYNRQNTTPIELQSQRRISSVSQSMNSVATVGRSKSTRMATPLARSNNNVLPPRLPENQHMQQINFPQGIRNIVPFAPHFSRTPLPQFQAPPNFQPPHPWQQQWQQQHLRQQNNNNRQRFNDVPDPPKEATFRAHRRSRSHPQLRPLPAPPILDNSTIQQARSVHPQIPQRQAPTPQIIENVLIDESKDDSNNSQKISKVAKRLSNSSRYKPSLSPVFEDRTSRLHLSPLHRSNSLPNLNDPEDLMRNESFLAPPVPLIPASLYPGNTNNYKSNIQVPKSQASIINQNNADKLERFIDAYGHKDYNMKPENLQYNYSDDNYNSWNTRENDDYVFDKRRPKSAHSVGGEARPKSSVSSIFGEDSCYNNHYYYEPSNYEMNQGAMNNYTYLQNLGPITPAEYNNGGKFVQKYPAEIRGDYDWANYNRQGSQKNY